MSPEHSVQPGSPADRRRDAAVHLTPLIPAAAAVAVIGRPALWAAPVLVLGPLVVGGILTRGRDAGRRHRRRAIDFNATVSLAALVLWGVLELGARFELAGVLVPVGLLLLALLWLNWLLMIAIAANWARYGELFEPPWVVPFSRWRDRRGRQGPRISEAVPNGAAVARAARDPVSNRVWDQERETTAAATGTNDNSRGLIAKENSHGDG